MAAVKRRTAALAVAALTLLLLVAAGVVWRASVPDDDAPRSPAAVREPARRRSPRAGRSTSESVGADPMPPPPRDNGDWLDRLARLLEDDSTDEDALAAILAEAGRGKAPGGGLHEVLRRATEERGSAIAARARFRAEDLIAWAIERAMRPYFQDRALFAKVYREVRFGDGRTDVTGGSLVRELRFDEAARKIAEIRPRLQTWCYDALALRVLYGFAHDESTLRGFRALCAQRGWEPPPAPGSPDAKTTTPSELWSRYVVPHFDEEWVSISFTWPRLLLDLGEADAAAASVERARQEVAKHYADPVMRTRWDEYLAPFDEEIRAIRELRDRSPWRVPESAAGLESWFGQWRPSLVAHAIGGDGTVEMGAWDDAMTRAYLEGGLPWAPEQWQVERARVAAARDEVKDGLTGWSVRSPNWDAFTDVSTEFAGETTLVLESGWAQAQTALGVVADHYEPVLARVYRFRDAYEAITHDRSGGHWVPGMNSVLTFLSDPDRTDFAQFRYPTLVHEATHAALSWGTRGVPAWMHEGLACWVARWSPAASIAANEAATRSWVRYRRSLLAARDAGTLPTLDQLLSIRSGWDADSFGPVTMARYAAAESLFVYLSDDSERWKVVGRWIAAARKGVDPATTLTPAERADMEKGWRDFVEFQSGRVETR